MVRLLPIGLALALTLSVAAAPWLRADEFTPSAPAFRFYGEFAALGGGSGTDTDANKKPAADTGKPAAQAQSQSGSRPKRVRGGGGSGGGGLDGRYTCSDSPDPDPDPSARLRDEIEFKNGKARGDFIARASDDAELDGIFDRSHVAGGAVVLDGNFIFRDSKGNKLRLKSARVEGGGRTVYVRPLNEKGAVVGPSFAFHRER